MNVEAKAGFVPEWVTPTARWFGMKMLSWDREAKSMRISCEPPRDVINFRGVIQGGFLAAMMDEAMGFNTHVGLGMTKAQATIDLHTHFLRPVPFGRVEIEARIVRAGRNVAFVEAELFDSAGELAARAVSSVKLSPIDGNRIRGEV